MPAKTSIEWTDSSWQLTRGCARVSEGCKHCYAESIARRFSGPGQPFEGFIHRNGAWNGKVSILPENLLIPWHWVKGRRIFVDSMSDLFHEQVPFEFIAAAFWVMSVTRRHTYQILTKRPERMLQFFEWLEDHNEGPFEGSYCSDCSDLYPQTAAIVGDAWRPATKSRGGYDCCGPAWPCDNVWLGVSVENRAAADARIPLLLQCPAAVRWVSAEPLLGPLNLRRVNGNGAPGYVCMVDALTGKHTDMGEPCKDLPALDWVICGGESGHGARPMHPDWARSLRDQCAAAGVPFLFKQWGEWVEGATTCLPTAVIDAMHSHGVAHFVRVGKKAAGRLLDGVQHDGFPK